MFRRDDFDLLNGLQTRLMFGARISQRRSCSEARGQERLRRWIHDVRRRIEIDAFLVVNPPIRRDKILNSPPRNIDRFVRSPFGKIPNQGAAPVRHPGTVAE